MIGCPRDEDGGDGGGGVGAPTAAYDVLSDPMLSVVPILLDRSVAKLGFDTRSCTSLTRLAGAE